MASVQDVFDLWKKTFDRKKALELKTKVVVQENVDGEGGGVWQVILENGGYRVVKGAEEKPQLELKYKTMEDFVNISLGKIGGAKAYMTGKVRFTGPQSLAQQFAKVFPPPQKE